MGLFRRRDDTPPPISPPEDDSVTLYSDDDLVRRAENIVHILGFRGAVGGRVLEVYYLLKKYTELDDESLSPTTDDAGGTDG